MGYRRKGLLEIEVYTFLALRLMGLGGQVHEASPVPSEKKHIALYRKLDKPLAPLYM